nr:hypothetical protein [Bacillus alveayuensis]
MELHNLYITTWDGRSVHVHKFSGVVGHSHKYVGVTEPAPSGVPHTHRYFTFTSFNELMMWKHSINRWSFTFENL